MTNIKTQVPPHLKVKMTTTQFLKYLKQTGRWEEFSETYRAVRAMRSSPVQALDAALDTIMGRLTFVWFGEEQLHRIHIDPHLILPELQK